MLDRNNQLDSFGSLPTPDPMVVVDVNHKARSFKNFRFCTKCDCIKPPRTHHCSICGVCVMRMDHHCPWVGNCVGLMTHKYFFCYLFWTVVACLHVGITTLIIQKTSCASNDDKCKINQTFRVTGASMIPIVALTFAGGVSILLFTHLRFLMYNESSIECTDLNFENNPYNQADCIENLK